MVDLSMKIIGLRNAEKELFCGHISTRAITTGIGSIVIRNI